MPPQANVPLPPGYQLEEYRIERPLSLGGFSIVYLLIGTYLTALAGFFLWLRHPVKWRAERP